MDNNNTNSLDIIVRMFENKEWLADLSLEERALVSVGFLLSGQFSDGRIVVIRQLLMNEASIEISPPFDMTAFDDVYHYKSTHKALVELLMWLVPDNRHKHRVLLLRDPDKKEPSGWVRHAPSYRRRSYDDIGNLILEWVAP